MSQQNPLFNRPASLPPFCVHILDEFVRDIDDTRVINEGSIECANSVAFALFISQRSTIESGPWVNTMIEGGVP